MKTISFDLSGKIDQQKIEALLTIKIEADILNIPFLLTAFVKENVKRKLLIRK